jgi:predicted nucleic acid-binding protein
VASVTGDTNIYISALQFRKGLPQRFLELAAAGVFRLHISDPVLNEILRVLRETFEWNTQGLLDQEDVIRSYTRHVTPTQTVDLTPQTRRQPDTGMRRGRVE